MFVGIVSKVKHAKFLVDNHSTAILTGMGVSGTIATAYLTGRATLKASKIIQQEETLRRAEVEVAFDEGRDGRDLYRPVTNVDKARLVWREFVPPVGVGIITITSIIAANKVSSKKIAALTIASGISERALQEYKDKVIEKFGERQDRVVRDEVAKDRVQGQPVETSQVIIVGSGDVLCYDMTSGRYFQSSMEDIKRAENRVNYELIHYMSASLSMFYEEIGLPPTTHSDSVGWNMNNPMEVVFSTVMSTDNRPCMAIDFKRQPVTDYDKTAWN